MIYERGPKINKNEYKHRDISIGRKFPFDF